MFRQKILVEKVNMIIATDCTRIVWLYLGCYYKPYHAN